MNNMNFNQNLGNNQMNNMSNMNMMNNNINMMNNMNNMNMMNNNINMNNQNQFPQSPQESEDTIFVTFTFMKNKKQIYIDIGKNQTFKEAISILVNKYEWLKNMGNLKFTFKGRTIEKNEYNKTIMALGIDESSDISIIN